MALHEDITQRRRQEQEITHLARHDPLTNLANRALFREQLQQALAAPGARPGLRRAVPRPRPLQERQRHARPPGRRRAAQAGERAPARAACARATWWRGSAATSSPSSRPTCASRRRPRRLPRASSRPISTPYEIDGQRIDIGTSIGMTLAPRDGTDADQLMKNADLALYRAKADGRNGYSFFKPEMNDQIQVRRALEIDLRKALRRGAAASCTTSRSSASTTQTGHGLRGAAALDTIPSAARCRRPSSSPLAEEIGLIGELGEWALRQACTQAARWPVPVKVAINLSPLQIQARPDRDGAAGARRTPGCRRTGWSSRSPNPCCCSDSQNTLAILHQLRQLGVRIAMDDFGTGYCSLSYLRSFPFDKIKIDRAFIADIDRSDGVARDRGDHDPAGRQPRHGDGGGGHRELRAAAAPDAPPAARRRRATISARRCPPARWSACCTTASSTRAWRREGRSSPPAGPCRGRRATMRGQAMASTALIE